MISFVFQKRPFCIVIMLRTYIVWLSKVNYHGRSQVFISTIASAAVACEKYIIIYYDLLR